MVAEFNVFIDTGGSTESPAIETNTDPLGTPNIRYKRADDPNIDNLDPNIIPTSGTSYSRWKSQYLKCTVAPDTLVNNIHIDTDGLGFGAGISVKVGNETPTKTSVSDAGYDVSDTDDDPLINHAEISGFEDFFSFTAGFPKLISISEEGGIIDAVDETCDYIVTQMEIIETASPGDLTNETITYEYEEV